MVCSYGILGDFVGFQIVCYSGLFCLLSLWVSEGKVWCVVEESRTKEFK